MNSDRLTKQIVIATLCAMAGGLVATVCSLALRQLPIPVEVKDLATYIIGVLSGMLIKTGIDHTLGEGDAPIPVTTPPGEPIEATVVPDQPTIGAKLPPASGDTTPP
ncbi:hypothetical protein IAD21_00585 [Abditibacteriota bacterium]|nr:hypothetical protein IAD21_00585 [Abditibacteriota bacterium]